LWTRARESGRFDERGASGGQAVQVDVSVIHSGDAVESLAPRRITGIVRNVFPLRGSEQGVHVVFAYPKASDKKNRLKEPKALTFKDRVPPFLHWALLRLQDAGGDAPAPVRLTMLAAGEVDLADQANAWDTTYCAADAAIRQAMEADLRRRLRGLVERWREGRQGLSRFYPKAGWEAVQAKPEEVAIAKAVRDVWVKDSVEFDGERDYAPGFTHLLERDLVFGEPETDVDSRALWALLRDAQQINELIMLGGAVERDATSVNAGAQEKQA
jgi:exodeoxyribonuclease V gamma subunit